MRLTLDRSVDVDVKLGTVAEVVIMGLGRKVPIIVQVH